jgi:hypothetical protein
MGKRRGKGEAMTQKTRPRGVSPLWGPMRIDVERSRQAWKRISRDSLEEALDKLGIEKSDGKTPALAENGATKEESEPS